jgi:hypothetical protein
MSDIHYDWLGQPITYEQWAELFADERHIGHDRIGNVTVSTVWMGTVWMGISNFEDPPLIFETMVFGGPLDQQTWRWATEAEARAGHAHVLADVREHEHQPQ